MTAVRKPAKNPEPPKAESPLVLVVDDGPDNRDMYMQYLEFSGLRVAEAQNGHEALQQAFSLLPDLIVWTLAARLDGWEASEIKERPLNQTGQSCPVAPRPRAPRHSKGASSRLRRLKPKHVFPTMRKRSKDARQPIRNREKMSMAPRSKPTSRPRRTPRPPAAEDGFSLHAPRRRVAGH